MPMTSWLPLTSAAATANAAPSEKSCLAAGATQPLPHPTCTSCGMRPRCVPCASLRCYAAHMPLKCFSGAAGAPLACRSSAALPPRRRLQCTWQRLGRRTIAPRRTRPAARGAGNFRPQPRSRPRSRSKSTWGMLISTSQTSSFLEKRARRPTSPPSPNSRQVQLVSCATARCGQPGLSAHPTGRGCRRLPLLPSLGDGSALGSLPCRGCAHAQTAGRRSAIWARRGPARSRRRHGPTVGTQVWRSNASARRNHRPRLCCCPCGRRLGLLPQHRPSAHAPPRTASVGSFLRPFRFENSSDPATRLSAAACVPPAHRSRASLATLERRSRAAGAVVAHITQRRVEALASATPCGRVTPNERCVRASVKNCLRSSRRAQPSAFRTRGIA